MKMKTLTMLIMAGALISGGVNTWASDDGDDGFRNGYNEQNMSRDNDDSGYGDNDRGGRGYSYSNEGNGDGSGNYTDQRCNGTDLRDQDTSCDSTDNQ